MNNVFSTKIKTGNILIYLICLYFMFLPFEYFFTTSAGSVLKFLAIIISLAIIINVIKTGFKFDVEKIILIIWLFYGLMSYYWSLSQTYWEIIYPTFSQNIMFVAIISFLKFSNSEYNKIIKSYLFSGTVMALYTIFVSSKTVIDPYEGRVAIMVNGAMFDPNYMVAILIIPIGIALTTFLNNISSTPIKSICNLILYLIMIIAALMTGSRGGFLGIITLTLLCIVSNLKSKKSKMGVFVLIIIAILLSGILINNLPQGVINRFSIESLIGKTDKGTGRLLIWKGSIEAIKNNPIIGYGVGNVFVANQMYVGRLAGSHNMYLNVLVEFGIIGILLFICFCINIFKKLINLKAYREIYCFISILIVCCFLDALTAKFLWGALIIFTIRTKTFDFEVINKK